MQGSGADGRRDRDASVQARNDLAAGLTRLRGNLPRPNPVCPHVTGRLPDTQVSRRRCASDHGVDKLKHKESNWPPIWWRGRHASRGRSCEQFVATDPPQPEQSLIEDNLCRAAGPRSPVAACLLHRRFAPGHPRAQKKVW